MLVVFPFLCCSFCSSFFGLGFFFALRYCFFLAMFAFAFLVLRRLACLFLCVAHYPCLAQSVEDRRRAWLSWAIFPIYKSFCNKRNTLASSPFIFPGLVFLRPLRGRAFFETVSCRTSPPSPLRTFRPQQADVSETTTRNNTIFVICLPESRSHLKGHACELQMTK